MLCLTERQPLEPRAGRTPEAFRSQVLGITVQALGSRSRYLSIYLCIYPSFFFLFLIFFPSPGWSGFGREHSISFTFHTFSIKKIVSLNISNIKKIISLNISKFLCSRPRDFFLFLIKVFFSFSPLTLKVIHAVIDLSL